MSKLVKIVSFQCFLGYANKNLYVLHLKGLFLYLSISFFFPPIFEDVFEPPFFLGAKYGVSVSYSPISGIIIGFNEMLFERLIPVNYYIYIVLLDSVITSDMY